MRDSNCHLPRNLVLLKQLSLCWTELLVNKSLLSKFGKALVLHLDDCLSGGPNREKMWRKFHTFGPPKTFSFYGTISWKSPSRWEALSFFSMSIKQHFPTAISVSNQETDASLSQEEKDILRYAAGYIPRNLLPTIQRSAHPNKENLKMCILDVIEDDGLGDKGWIQQLNRGGLNDFSCKMFQLMIIMEFVVCIVTHKSEIIAKRTCASSGSHSTDTSLQWCWNHFLICDQIQ